MSLLDAGCATGVLHFPWCKQQFETSAALELKADTDGTFGNLCIATCAVKHWKKAVLTQLETNDAETTECGTHSAEATEADLLSQHWRLPRCMWESSTLAYKRDAFASRARLPSWAWSCKLFVSGCFS